MSQGIKTGKTGVIAPRWILNLDSVMDLCAVTWSHMVHSPFFQVDNLKEIRPRQFFAVPRVYEKMQEKMQDAAAQNNFLLKAVANWAKGVATRHHEGVRAGTVTEPGWQYLLAKKLVFK